MAHKNKEVNSTFLLVTALLMLSFAGCELFDTSPVELNLDSPETYSLNGDGDYELTFVARPGQYNMVDIVVKSDQDMSKSEKGSRLMYDIYKDDGLLDAYANHLFIPTSNYPVIPLSEEVYINVEAFGGFHGSYTIEVKNIQEKQLTIGSWLNDDITEEEKWFYFDAEPGQTYTISYRDVHSNYGDFTGSVEVCVCYSDLGKTPYAHGFKGSRYNDSLTITAEEDRVFVSISLYKPSDVDNPSGTFSVRVE
jgi:hypothetical protein